jgi:hypothetical protein
MKNGIVQIQSQHLRFGKALIVPFKIVISFTIEVPLVAHPEPIPMVEPEPIPGPATKLTINSLSKITKFWTSELYDEVPIPEES